MTDKRTSLEIIAPTVEEAIAQGLSDLGLTEDDVDIDVLDMGSRGLFGLGSRMARVRLTIKASDEDYVSSSTLASYTRPESTPLQTGDQLGEEGGAFAGEEINVSVGGAKRNLSDEIVMHVAQETVSELLEQMKVRGATIEVKYIEPEDPQGRQPVYVDIQGDDLSILIGPKAETLNALQYITSLIVGKELGRSIPLIVDVQGYRMRRADQIRKLARSMAEQAVKTGRRQMLEPMSASERRLVHIELRNYPGVITESIGEEPRRKVTIVPQ